jgi:hypothetical protein
MVMSIQPNGSGGYQIRQTLKKPVVYLDHWAVRLFSDDEPLQNRFLSALHKSGGTWLFSTANLFEFTAMTDLIQAQATERLLSRALPALHVADTTLDRGYLLVEGAPAHPNAPEEHWLLKDLGERAMIAGGILNTHRFVQDAITHRDQLSPLFDDLKREISIAVMALTEDKERHSNARKFAPRVGMTLRNALSQELFREPHVNEAYVFDENDAMDLIHAVPAAVVCDLILLDARWCHKVSSAAKRMRKGGITGKIAQCFSKAKVSDFLLALESTKPRSS